MLRVACSSASSSSQHSSQLMVDGQTTYVGLRTCTGRCRGMPCHAGFEERCEPAPRSTANPALTPMKHLIPHLANHHHILDEATIRNHHYIMSLSSHTPADQRRGLVTLLLFGALECILLLYHRAELSTRDISAVKVATLILLVLPFLIASIPTTWYTHVLAVQVEKTPRFRAIFSRLSLAEIFFTVIIPWIQILLVTGNAYMALPHLFVFQAQIVLESLILAEGSDCKFALFPFTAVANIYRFANIYRWWMNSQHICSNNESSTIGVLQFCCELILPSIGLLLWSYSTLIFIPLEWYPLLTRKKW